jgi:hypothetical protein
MLVPLYQKAWRHISEECNLNIHHKNINSQFISTEWIHNPNTTHKSYTLNKRNTVLLCYLHQNLHSSLKIPPWCLHILKVLRFIHIVSMTFKKYFITLVTMKIHSQLSWSQCFSQGGKEGERYWLGHEPTHVTEKLSICWGCLSKPNISFINQCICNPVHMQHLCEQNR